MLPVAVLDASEEGCLTAVKTVEEIFLLLIVVVEVIVVVVFIVFIASHDAYQHRKEDQQGHNSASDCSHQARAQVAQ